MREPLKYYIVKNLQQLNKIKYKFICKILEWVDLI